jgi:hypothetical protein
MTAALVEMKVETKNPSENKSRVPHCERKNGGHQQRGGMVWNAYLLVLNTPALLFLSQGIIYKTHHDYGTHMGNVRLNETKIGERNSKHNQQQHLCRSNILE